MASTPNPHPLVSVILPTYDRLRFLRDAVKSVVSQTYTNWEMIVVDGGSNDVSAASGAEAEARCAILLKAAQALKAELPKGMTAEVVRDNSRPIRVAVKNVKRTLIEGALLTVLIVFLFLNSWRSTVITGLTLPISIIGTFLFMHMLGFTINMVTLMALSLCVGLLIDDAIVVRENIVRHIEMGKDHFRASHEGTDEIGMAVAATTFSIVAVFVPIGFMYGTAGQWFKPFALTIAMAVLVSDTGEESKAVWLPLSRIEIESKNKTVRGTLKNGQFCNFPLVTVTLPERLAIEKGLV